jgi:CubicO group peptidase (beta-lactamase class C family)
MMTVMDPNELADVVAKVAAETGFDGVVGIDRAGTTELAVAYGLAHRGFEIPNTTTTRFALASGGKSFTALTVMRLVEKGQLSLDTRARELLGTDLPLIDDRVTIEHLLSHRSGIGDYLDEDEEPPITDYVLKRPVHELLGPEDFVPLLDGFPAKFAPGEDFSYCNGGYVVLALLAERAARTFFHELVETLVLEPAGLRDTAFLRSDEPSVPMALGYLPIEGVDRTNVFHLPVRGSGDGGIYSTLADIAAFWRALFAGRIVTLDNLARMTTPYSDVQQLGMSYGLGFWLNAKANAVQLEGMDAGVSFRSVYDRGERRSWTVISNTTDDAWPMAKRLAAILTPFY